MNINDLFPLFASLVGFPAFVAALANVAKYFGLLADGDAPKFVMWAHLAGFVAVAVAYFLGYAPVIAQIDAQLGSLATFLLTLIAFLSDLGLAKVFNAGLRGTPVIGKSYSQEDFG